MWGLLSTQDSALSWVVKVNKIVNALASMGLCSRGGDRKE